MSGSEDGTSDVDCEEPSLSSASSLGVQLSVVDQAFGPKSDLYRDVLGVKPNATPEQIQRAYFQRRHELFQLLADMGEANSSTDDDGDAEGDSDENGEYNLSGGAPARRSSSRRAAATKRRNAESKLDAVVMAMRVLGDPELRNRYDDLRTDRLRGRSSPLRPQNERQHQQYLHAETIRVEPSKVKRAPSAQQQQQQQERQSVSTKKQSKQANSKNKRQSSAFSEKFTLSRSSSVRKKKKDSRVVTPEMTRSRKTSDYKATLRSNSNHGLRFDTSDDREQSDNDTMGNNTWTDEGTILSETSEGTLMTTRKKGFVQRVADEVMGAIEDTSASFDQVFNAFTLQEEDIRAVRYRIDKVRRQIERSL